MQSDEFITSTDFEEYDLENMINNASFEIFNSGDNTYPDFWSLLGEEDISTTTINRVELGYIGSSAVKIEDSSTSKRFAIQQEIYSESELPSSLLNETITLSVWVKRDVASGIAIGEIAINDGSTRTVSSLGDTQSWYRVSLTHIIALDATKLVVELCPTLNISAETAIYHFDAVMLTLGSFTPSFDLNTLDQLSTESLHVSKLTVSDSLGIGTTTPGGLLGLQDANTYINVDGSNNLTFTDAITGTKTLAELVDDADADPTNEIQTISRTGLTVTLSNGGGTFIDSVNVYTSGTGIDITGNVISTTDITLAIGDSYQGGIIFWLDTSGKHGLIAATTDQSTGILWYNGSYTTTNAVRDGVYAGQYNTERIINNQGTGDYAAQLCANYQGGNYGDWYLPSIYELYLMYLQRTAIGGFVGYYWSSTEYDSTNAWRYYVDGGTSQYSNKGLTYTVRAVRAF